MSNSGSRGAGDNSNEGSTSPQPNQQGPRTMTGPAPPPFQGRRTVEVGSSSTSAFRRWEGPGVRPPAPAQEIVPAAPQPPAPPAGRMVWTCVVCQLQFDSERSISGHMGSHRERDWSGILPPPVFTMDEFVAAGVGHRLNPPYSPEDQSPAAEDNEAGEQAGAGLNFDLNRSPEQD